MEDSTNIALKATELTKSYGKSDALRGVSLSLPADRIIGLLGPNGSGKTTLLKLAAGLLSPSAGSIEIYGNPIGVKSKELTAFLPDRNFLHTWMTINQLLNMFADFFENFQKDNAKAMLQNLGVRLDSKLSTLSKGNQEKVHLILTMCRRAKLYLLDEPIGGVDPATRDYVLDTVIKNRSDGATVLISTHLISDVESILDNVVFINAGKVFLYSDVNELKSEKGKTIDEIFREEFRCLANF